MGLRSCLKPLKHLMSFNRDSRTGFALRESRTLRVEFGLRPSRGACDERVESCRQSWMRFKLNYMNLKEKG